METTVVRKIKRGQGLGRWPAYILGQDSYGLWLHSPAGTLYRGETPDGIVELEVGQGNRQAGVAVVQLIPKAGWWIASWSADGASSSISVDICTPPSLISGEWTYDDLELDPQFYFEGSVQIEDEDEFVAVCDLGIITADEEIAAQAAATEMEGLLRGRLEPFGYVGWNKLDEALSLALAPLKELA